MTTAPMPQSDFNLVHPAHYAERGYPHDLWTWMRREEPVYWFDRSGGVPFWAITKHRDIHEISTQPDKFLSDPLLVLQPEQEEMDDRFPKTLRLVQHVGDKRLA